MLNIPDVNVVITAAGDSRGLFMAAGFGGPKSLVDWDGTEVINRAIASYGNGALSTHIAINADEDREWGIGKVVYEKFPGVRVVPISSNVKGALASALLALPEIDDEPLVVAAGDSRITSNVGNFVQDFLDSHYSAATVAFESQESRWSYLSVNREMEVEQVAEKRVIGPYATTGFFFFQSSRTFVEAATWVLVNNASHEGNFYVSATLNHLIAKGESVGYRLVDRHEYESRSLPVDFV